MVRGTFTYHLFGIKWIPMKRKFFCAESFDEMTPLQLEWWCEYIWDKSAYYFSKPVKELPGIINDEERFVNLSIHAIAQISNIPKWLFFTLDNESLRNIIYNYKLHNFLFKDAYTPEINPVPKIDKFYGPINAEVLVPFEFALVDNKYMKYKETQDIKFLNVLLAHLYRPADKDYDPEKSADIRMEFKDHSWVRRIDAISGAPHGRKLLVLYWYENWRNNLLKFFPHLFTKENQQKAKGDKGWMPVFQSAANGAQNLPGILHMNLLLLMSDINRIIGEQKELKKKLEKDKRNRK